MIIEGLPVKLWEALFSNLHEKTGRLAEEAARVGIKLNARKCKTLRTGFAHSRESIVVNGEEVEDVEKFAYLGAIVDKEGGGSKDIVNRLQKYGKSEEYEGEPRYATEQLPMPVPETFTEN